MTTWTIQSTMIKKQEAGHTDVVYLVEWIASDTDGVNEVRRGGQTELSLSTKDFIPYDQLTEQQVLDWAWAAMGDEAKIDLESELNMQIVYMQNPPIVSEPLPWLTIVSEPQSLLSDAP
jgi:hypothetical protein